MMKPFTHCSFCGTLFPAGNIWPKSCLHCSNTTWRNPTPVSVLLVPYQGKLIGIRRKNTNKAGMLSLPGGFITLGESWQEAAARETLEETGIAVDTDHITLFDVVSAPDGTLLIFGALSNPGLAILPPFVPNKEASERVLLSGAEALAFPIHERIVNNYFTQRSRT